MAENGNSVVATRATSDGLRVKPTALIAFAIAIGYVGLFTVLEKFIGPAYTDLGTTADSVLRGIVIPLAICAIVMAVITTLLGWWRPVLREKRLGVKWMWAIPAILVVMVLYGVDYTQLGAVGLPYLAWLAIGTLLVGFNEEITYRGLALVGFRGSYKEVWAWLLTSVFFGLLHGANIILGQDVVTTVKQIVLAFIIGTLFYASRRVTGSIVFVMIVHALWDFGTFTWIGGRHATGVAAVNFASLASLPLMLIMLVIFAIGAKRMFTVPVEAA